MAVIANGVNFINKILISISPFFSGVKPLLLLELKYQLILEFSFQELSTQILNIHSRYFLSKYIHLKTLNRQLAVNVKLFCLLTDFNNSPLQIFILFLQPCKYGISCLMRTSGCMFTHPSLPSKDQLKWTKTETEATS